MPVLDIKPTHSNSGLNVAVHNPHNKPIEDLPVIYGFNNGGPVGFMDAVLLAQDGNCLGGHLCSNEYFMPGDLGITEGSRPDRHEGFEAHYPDGYRMEFISGRDIKDHDGLNAAFAANQALGAKAAAEKEQAPDE